MGQWYVAGLVEIGGSRLDNRLLRLGIVNASKLGGVRGKTLVADIDVYDAFFLHAKRAWRLPGESGNSRT